MKKLFFLGLISIGTVAFAQDFSWGISTYAGLTKVNTTTDNISPIEIGRDRSLNLSTYMDYRLAGPFHLKAELFTQSARQLSLYNYFASTTYYFPSFSNYYDANCIINFQEINKNRSFDPDHTFVIVGYYKDQEHLDWILKNNLYNLRTGTGLFVLVMLTRWALCLTVVSLSHAWPAVSKCMCPAIAT